MISIVHNYYDQERMLAVHRAAWQGISASEAALILIDDGSPSPIPRDFRLPHLRIYRIAQDIPWNIAGSRNLGFHVAQTEWVFSADIDHVVTPETLEKIGRLDRDDPNVVYTFARCDETGRRGCDAIINILMNRERFFEIGGYDEDYSGHYGKEDTFFLHCLRRHRVKIRKCEHIVLEWYPRSGRTPRLDRSVAINTRLFEEKYAALKSRTYQNGPILRFTWSEVT